MIEAVGAGDKIKSKDVDGKVWEMRGYKAETKKKVREIDG